MNIPAVRAAKKLNALSERMYSAKIIYDLVMDVTGNKDEAEEAMTKWVEGRVNSGKDAYAPVTLDSINISSAVADIANMFKGGSLRSPQG